MQTDFRRQFILLALISLLAIPILTSRQPLPTCQGPKFGATSQIPILLDELQRYSLDDLFVGYNLNFSSSNLPSFAYLRQKNTQIDASGFKINGLQNYNIDFGNYDNLATLTILSKDNGRTAVSWGIATVNTQVPNIYGTVIIDQVVECFDAVWISGIQMIIADCVKKESFSLTNYYYYIDTVKLQVIGKYKNQVYQYFTGNIKRKLGVIRKDDSFFMVRAYIALEDDNKSQQNTYIELISLNNPMKPFTINIFDRSRLQQDKLSITDVKIYKDNIYILDYFSGLIQLDINDKNVFRLRGSYKIGTGFRNLGIYQNRYGSKELLAFADRNKIIQVDWSDKLKPQLVNKYSIPENSDVADLWLNQQNIVVHLTAKYTNQRRQTKTRESTYVLTRGSRTYTSASLVFAHLIKTYSILYPYSNKILLGDENGLKLIEVNSPLLLISPKDPLLVGKDSKFMVVAESKNDFSPDLSLKCTSTFEFIILSEEQTLNYLSNTGQKFPEYFSVNYPGQLYIPLEKYFRGSNITYGITFNESNSEKQSSYFLKQNSTVITWKDYQPSQVAFSFLKTQFSSERNSNYISLFTQDAMNRTVFSKCELMRLTEKINCFHNIEVPGINYKVSKMAISSSKFGIIQQRSISAITYQDIPNEVFFYNGEDGTDIGIPPIIFPEGFDGSIAQIEFMNQYFVVVLGYSKSVILYDMNECIDNLPNSCKQAYTVDSTFFNGIQKEYFAPLSVFKANIFPTALFIQCLDRIIVIDVSTNGIFYLAQIILSQFKNPWKMVISGTNLIVVYPPATILQYDLSDMYISRYITFTRKYPWFNYRIPENFSLRSSTTGSSVYLTVYDTMMQKEDTLVILVFKVGVPSVSVLYDVYGIKQSSTQEKIMIDVIGNPLLGDYITFTKGVDLNIFREYQNPRLIFENMLNDFSFNLTVSNDPLNRFSFLLESSVRSTSQPQNITISNKDISKTGFFDISLDVGEKIDITNFNDQNWFEGSVLNYTIEGCDGCGQKVRIKNHIQLESVQQAIRGLYDYTSGEKGGYIQAYSTLIKVLNNGTVQQFASLSTESRGEVCTSVAYNEDHSYTVSACENGERILLYVAVQTTFKPFVIGPLQSSARQVTKIESLGDIIMLVDTDSDIGEFRSQGRIFIYSLSDNPYESEALNELEIINSDDLNSAIEWEGGPCFIGNANLTYSTMTDTYRLIISQLRNGMFIVEFIVSEGVRSVEILKISFINLQQQLKRTGLTLPNNAFFTALATIKQTYDVRMRIQSVNIIVTTNNYHSFLLNLMFDQTGALLSLIIVRVFYRYGVYETQNYLKTFNRYFAIVQKAPSYIESDKYSKTVLTVYDTLLTEEASEDQFNPIKEEEIEMGNNLICYMKGGYVMGQGDIFFDWDRTAQQQNSGSNKLFAINGLDYNIYELSVNNEVQMLVEESVSNNQKGYFVAQNDFDSQKFLFTITKNYGKSQDVPFEYDHQRVAFSPDYSQVYTYGPSTKTVSNHSYEQWNKRSSFELDDAPAFIDFYSIENKLGFVMITADGMVKHYKSLNEEHGIPLTTEPLSGVIKRLAVSSDGSYYAAAFLNSSFVYVGELAGSSTPKQYDFSQYGQINNIRWSPKQLKLMISAGANIANHRQNDQSVVYLGQLDISTGIFADYSQIVQLRVVDLDYSKDASTLYYIEEIKQAGGNSFVAYTLALNTKEKTEYINSTFFGEWSQVVMIQLKDTLLLVKSAQRAKVCKNYPSGINCFQATDKFLGGTLSPGGLEWVNYGIIGGYSAGLENIQITRYCGALKYYSQADNSCQLCHASCLTCISSSTFCSSCSDGLFLSVDNTCDPCSEGCEFCRNGEQCSCKDSYYQSPKSCQLCSEVMPGCYTCDLESQCKVCYISQHWELANSQCRCMERYFQQNNQCSNCPNFCLQCQSADVCVTCDPKAHTVADEKGVCQCQQGYILNGGECQLCSSLVLGCQTCSAPYKCQSCDAVHHFKKSNDICICADGFTLDNQSCELCSSFILGCLTCSNKDQCLTCNQISHFDLKDNKCICQDGFGLKDKSCQACSSLISGCLKCNDLNTCTSCNELGHFNLNNSKCICSEGYGLDGSKCSQCSLSILGCVTCKDAKTCLSCNRTSNFDLIGSTCSCVQRYTLLSDKKCHLCSSVIDHCILCSSSSVCTACEQPFILDSHSCIEKSQPNTLLIALGVGAAGIIIGFIIACVIFRRKRGHKESLMTDTLAQSITIKDSLKVEQLVQQSS